LHDLERLRVTLRVGVAITSRDAKPPSGQNDRNCASLAGLGETIFNPTLSAASAAMMPARRRW